jgi:hypothetical protein
VIHFLLVDLQNTTQKSEDRETLTPTKILGELRCFEGGKQFLLHMSFMDRMQNWYKSAERKISQKNPE